MYHRTISDAEHLRVKMWDRTFYHAQGRSTESIDEEKFWHGLFSEYEQLLRRF